MCASATTQAHKADAAVSYLPRQLASWKRRAHNICPALIEDDIQKEIWNPLSLFQRQLNSHLPLMQRKLRLMDIICFSVERWNEGSGGGWSGGGGGVGGFKCEH